MVADINLPGEILLTIARSDATAEGILIRLEAADRRPTDLDLRALKSHLRTMRLQGLVRRIRCESGRVSYLAS